MPYYQILAARSKRRIESRRVRHVGHIRYRRGRAFFQALSFAIRTRLLQPGGRP
jgi:hypothetical protein